MTDPMTPERLAEIRVVAGFAAEHLEDDGSATEQTVENMFAVLAEVERFRAELAEADHVATVTGEKLDAVRGQRDRAEAERDEARAEVEQWRTTFGESALRDGLARMARVEAERNTARAELTGAYRGAEELRNMLRDRTAERDEARTALVAADKLAAGLRAELAAYHAAAESTDLEGDVGDHLTPLADWQTENGTAPEWLVDAVIGLIVPVKAERDRLTEQVNGDRLHTVIEAALIAYWCLERGKREPDRLDLANAWSHAAVLVDALRRAGLPTGREALHDAHGVGDAVASALSRLDGAEVDQ